MIIVNIQEVLSPRPLINDPTVRVIDDCVWVCSRTHELLWASSCKGHRQCKGKRVGATNHR